MSFADLLQALNRSICYHGFHCCEVLGLIQIIHLCMSLSSLQKNLKVYSAQLSAWRRTVCKTTNIWIQEIKYFTGKDSGKFGTRARCGKVLADAFDLKDVFQALIGSLRSEQARQFLSFPRICENYVYRYHCFQRQIQ